MALFQQTSSSEDIEEAKKSDMILLAAAASVVLSLHEFYINDNPERAVFIGHWPPTILAFAIYVRDRMK
ncbi:hypothetical protein [Halogranum amylolyticum]|nr:hypothetical protein [Halogranum amylolyticum]